MVLSFVSSLRRDLAEDMFGISSSLKEGFIPICPCFLCLYFSMLCFLKDEMSTLFFCMSGGGHFYTRLLSTLLFSLSGLNKYI